MHLWNRWKQIKEIAWLKPKNSQSSSSISLPLPLSPSSFSLSYRDPAGPAVLPAAMAAEAAGRNDATRGPANSTEMEVRVRCFPGSLGRGLFAGSLQDRGGPSTGGLGAPLQRWRWDLFFHFVSHFRPELHFFPVKQAGWMRVIFQRGGGGAESDRRASQRCCSAHVLREREKWKRSSWSAAEGSAYK